jgi:NAD(P)-dependent dehydrogenase (short-subunit alcohol dehydrogenase family)
VSATSATGRDGPAGRERVVVTGASAGLGRAIAHEAARHGARVALLARNADGLGAAAREVGELGGEALPLVVDVSDAAAVDAAADRAAAAWGGIDIWVNNAMVSVFARVTETTAEEYRRVTDVTYLGYVHGTRAALRHMLPADRGHIVQVGSALAYRSIPLQSAYCAAKHAIIGFTDSLRSELIHDGRSVRVTVVNMPALNTPQFRLVRSRLPRKAQPVPPIYQPEVGARAVWWAAHHERREVQVGWPTVEAIVGQKLVPGFLDRYLARHAWDAQMTDEPRDPDRPDDVFAPVPGDHGTHGVFDARSRGRSLLATADRHRGSVAALTGIVTSLAGATLVRARRDTRQG